MRKCANIVAGIAAAIVLACIARGQTTATTNQTPKIDVNVVMSAADQQKTGVASLDKQQVAALNAWLTHYTFKWVMSVLQSVEGPYKQAGDEHAIRENAGGVVLRLDDGSIWEVDQFDRIDSRLWLAASTVIVIRDKTATGTREYRIINTDEGETVHAEYLGSGDGNPL